MKENKEKREFARQLEQIAETLTQAVKTTKAWPLFLSVQTGKRATTTKTAIRRSL